MSNVSTLNNQSNPLGSEPVGKLLRSFAVPSIVAMLVGSLYNIVDQFFIGQKIGELGNAATNIAFPLSIACVATALVFGIGGASNFNLFMGAGQNKKAETFMGNSIALLLTGGFLLLVVAELFLEPMLRFFGSPENVLPYAVTYTRITAIGFPFFVFSNGGCHLIRADGRPRMSMFCNIVGAVINTVLDAVFVFGLEWGMAGAALATVIGQIASAAIAGRALLHSRTCRILPSHLKVTVGNVKRIVSLGLAPFCNQVAMMVVQIVMNKSLKYYGSMSIYGEAIPIACVGIITKVNHVFMSFIIGLAQGLQPISSFNYGAAKFRRVKKSYLLAVAAGASFAVVAFLLFQFCPRQIISVFGKGSSEAYYTFAIRYFRVFLFFTFLNFMQPISSSFFTAVGKPGKGTFLSLTRQIIFLLPLILIFPLFLGIDGIMYAGPVADGMSAALGIVMAIMEFRGEEYNGHLL